MKVFMIAWVVFCFLVIAGLFIAYATDNFPGVPVPQAEYAQGEILTEDECSPCEENLKRLKAAMEQSDLMVNCYGRAFLAVHSWRFTSLSNLYSGGKS